MRFWTFGRRDSNAEPLPPEEDEERIVLIPARSESDSDLLSDSQSGEIHRIFERGGQRQIDAVPIVRRLLGRDITARTVALLAPPESSPEADGIFLGLHFVLDERTRHIYRVAITPRCCLAERLWGKGLDEVHERPLGGPLLSWRDLHDAPARASLAAVTRLVPEASGWALRFASLQTEAGSDVQRRLYTCPQGHLRHHLRPSPAGARAGTEGAIEIAWQGRILRTFEPAPASSSAYAARPAARVTSEAGELAF